MIVREPSASLALLLVVGVASAGSLAGLPVGPVGVAAADAPDCTTVSFDGGNGTATDPYRVATLDGLQCVREDPGAHYVLVADVDASATARWNDGRGFEPVGGSGVGAFTGTFDGRGHEIRGLSIDRQSSGVGLFGDVDDATIRNVRLVDANVTGIDEVGALVGRSDGATVAHSVVSGTVAGEVHVGGLVGLNGDGGRVVGSSAAATVDGARQVGGLVGRNERRSLVREARAAGEVTADQQVGGLVGENHRSTVADAAATGDVTGRISVGGLVGVNEGGAVRRSNASGTVTDSGDGIFAGGLVGLNEASGTVEQSYATGAVRGNSGVGGLVGTNERNSTVAGTYAAGPVSGKHAGGLVGVNRENATVERSYWDVDATGRTSSAGLSQASGLSTAEMTGAAARRNMDALDFASTWTATDGYPGLSRELETGPVTGRIAFHDQTVRNGTTTVRVASANASVAYYVELTAADGTTARTDTFAAGDRRTGLAVALGGPLTARTSLTATVRAADDDVALATATASITVRSANRAASPLSGVPGEFDADADGDIGVAELADAGRAFARDELSIGDLGAVARAFAG